MNSTCDDNNLSTLEANLDNDLKNAATLLNISSRTLSLMLLSNNSNHIHCITLIRNLSESLKEYPEGNLPDQLSQYIIQLNQHMQDNPILEDDIPSFFELICPIVQQPLIIHDLNNNTDNQDFNNVWNDDINNNSVIFIPVSDQNIKDDLCVICFINLNQELDVVETVCKHQYHNTCISRWINVKQCCPLCNCNL